MDEPTATYDDVLAAPEGARAELVDGELLLQAAPAVLHQDLVLAIGAELRERHRHADDGDGPGGWRIVVGPELWLGTPDPRTLVLVPDVAGWRRERWPRRRETHGVTVAPDWVCEVLSPSTLRHDRVTKLDAYGRAGVAWVWLVDPDARVVEVYERSGDAWRRALAVEAAGPVELPPFPGATWPEAWWADVDAG